MEQTLLMIKPDAYENHHVGEIISIMEKKGLTIRDITMETLTRERAEGFYEVHRDKPFFGRLIDLITSGPVISLILEHENCVDYVREIIGTTDPEKAAEGTVRKLYARTITINAVHASDSRENAKWEITYIFGGREPDTGEQKENK